ncbi:MAG: prephenate dehydrogenase [Clostridiales bacterium]|nr:prephenate dehydrogenase [Clostridiales bacterium]
MKIGIIGLGLIGGSLGRAIRGMTGSTVYGTDISDAAVAKAELVGAIDKRLLDADFSSLDLLIYAVTPRVILERSENEVKLLKDGTVVLDIAGTKSNVAAKMKELSVRFPSIEFVAAHPMAGKELSGISASSAGLFERASILLVPVKAELATLAFVKNFFYRLGFDYVRFTNASEHDKIIAYTSQLPHVLSSCYIGSPTAAFHHGFSAGSFRDLSRVARMSAGMWAELFTENKENLIAEIDGMIDRLNETRNLIAAGDEEKLKIILDERSRKKEEIDKADRAWKKDNGKN